MKNTHASVQEIQEYATGQPGEALGNAHIGSCGYCLAEVKNYQILFAQLKKEPAAAFDFDLAALVVAQLPKTNSRLSADRFIAGFLVLFIGCFIGIPAVLFRQYILNMFSGISPFFIYSMICGAALVLICKALEMYQNYRKQMQVLNFN